VEDRLKARIIDGDRDGLERDLDEALAGSWPGLSIINDVLLEGMKVVGELFGTGEMQQVGELLQVGRIGVTVSEEDQLHPEQSTSAIVVHHPEAKYFIA
jgi:cobalamin-dependent methionine synthase I